MRVLKITNMYPNSYAPSSGTFVKSEADSLMKQGVEVDLIFINGRKNKLQYLWGIPRLWARLLTRRYDLIHAHYVFCGFIARMQLLYPVVLTHHRPGILVSRETPLCRIINRLIDRVIVRSQEIKNSPGYGKSEVIAAGVDFDLFKLMPQAECREVLGLPANKKLVLWAGDHNRTEKRFDIVQTAVALLKQELPDVELVLVSGKPQSLVPQYMNACDALLLVSDAEGSPNVVKEAMACNLPVVATPVGDVPEIIGGTDGCYLCSQDPKDVAEKLEAILRRGRRTNGRNDIRHLELGAVAQQFNILYEEVIREKKGKGLARLWFWQKAQVADSETQPL